MTKKFNLFRVIADAIDADPPIDAYRISFWGDRPVVVYCRHAGLTYFEAEAEDLAEALQILKSCLDERERGLRAWWAFAHEWSGRETEATLVWMFGPDAWRRPHRLAIMPVAGEA